MIRHILDQVLSYDGPPAASITKSSEVTEQEFPVGDLLSDVDVTDRDMFLDWMDGTVEHKSDSWLRWINFN